MSTRLVSERFVRVGGCVLAVALGVGVYLNSLHNPFIYDDFRTIVDNGSIASLRNVSAIVMHEATRPITNLSFAVDRGLWGQDSFGFHATNIGLHAVNIGLVFLLALGVWRDAAWQSHGRGQTVRATRVATVTALVFAVHPVLAEAVGYISGRADLLSAGLLMTAFLAARAWLIRGEAVWLWVVWPAWAAALLTKEVAAMFPFAVGAYSMLVRAPRDRARVLTRPMFLGMFCAVAVRVAVFVWFEQASPRTGLAPVLAMAPTLMQYLQLLLLPAGQSIFHPAISIRGAGDPMLWLAVGIVVAIGGFALRNGIRGGVVSFGAVWFFVMLFPALLLGLTTDAAGVAEHRAYVPALGFALVIGGAVEQAAPVVSRFRSTRILGVLALASTVLMLAGRTYIRNLVWADPVNVWEEAVASAPDHWLPQAALGESLHRAGRHDEAVAAFRRSLSFRPENEGTALNLVVCLSELARFEEAAVAVAKLERQQPLSASVPIGRGTIAVLEGRPLEARPFFLEALKRDPENVMARQWLAVVAEGTNDRAEALHRCYELQRLAPGRASIASCIERMRTP